MTITRKLLITTIVFFAIALLVITSVGILGLISIRAKLSLKLKLHAFWNIY